MVRDFLAAARYARALFEIARLLHRDEEIEAELGSFSSALKASPDLEKFFLNPRLSLDGKRGMLQKIYQERRHEIYEQLLNFYTLLIEKNRFYLIHEIAVQFKRIADEAQGRGTAEIRTAAPLSSKAEQAIASRLERLAGYKIAVRKEVDPSLVGGVSVKVRHQVIDGSVRNRLDRLKKELMKKESSWL